MGERQRRVAARMVAENERTVCVTGASGFIASWLVRKLLEKGYKVHGTVRSPDKCGHLRALDGAKERLRLFKADVLDYDSLVQAISDCDGVFHTACPVAEVFKNPEDVLSPAITGTENVLKACHEAKIKRIVMTSSAAAVMYTKAENLDEYAWSNPDFCRDYKLWYALAKTESEKLAWELSEKLKLDLVTICPVYVLGPLLQPTLNASTKYLRSLLDGSMTSYPNRIFPTVDVRDTAKAHIAALEDISASGRYLCFGKWQSYTEVIKSLKRLFPHYPYPEMPLGHFTGVDASHVSNKRLRSLVKNFVPFEQMLADTVRSLQEKGFLPK